MILLCSISSYLGVVGRIRLHCEWQIMLEVEQDRRRCEGELELPERRCCFLRPGKLDPFTCERGQGGGKGAVVRTTLVCVPN